MCPQGRTGDTLWEIEREKEEEKEKNNSYKKLNMKQWPLYKLILHLKKHWMFSEESNKPEIYICKS